MLEITEAGYKYFKIKNPMQQGKGSSEHKYWQRRILSNHYESGRKAKIEWYLNGKSADLGVVMDGKLMAVEVALTPKNEMRNIKEDLDVGFHSVLVACRNSKVKQEVDKRINENLGEEEKERVATCLLTDFI